MKTINKDSNGFIHWVLFVIILAVVAALTLFAFTRVKEKNTSKTASSTSAPSQFIQADFVDLSKIYSISKFRSGEGHDFSGGGETCRSMKHYFTPQIDVTLKPEKAADGRSIPPQPDGVHDIDIYSPVDGKITDITEERLPVGEQIYIQPDAAKSYTVRLFHVYKSSGIAKGTTVKAGQKIGVISGYSTTDIALDAGNNKYVSYFDAMPDSLFAAYQKRGATTRDDFIFSKEYRDAHPIPCNQDKQGDQSFYYPSDYDHDADDFHLSGYIKPDYSKAQQGQQNLN